MLCASALLSPLKGRFNINPFRNFFLRGKQDIVSGYWATKLPLRSNYKQPCSPYYWLHLLLIKLKIGYSQALLLPE